MTDNGGALSRIVANKIQRLEDRDDRERARLRRLERAILRVRRILELAHQAGDVPAMYSCVEPLERYESERDRIRATLPAELVVQRAGELIPIASLRRRGSP